MFDVFCHFSTVRSCEDVNLILCTVLHCAVLYCFAFSGALTSPASKCAMLVLLLRVQGHHMKSGEHRLTLTERFLFSALHCTVRILMERTSNNMRLMLSLAIMTYSLITVVCGLLFHVRFPFGVLLVEFQTGAVCTVIQLSWEGWHSWMDHT